MDIDALLCDHATVRDGLLHLLGGGITRVTKTRYPTELGIFLAMILTLTPSEGEEKHRVRVNIVGMDGQQIAEVNGELGVKDHPNREPGEGYVVPLPLSLASIPIPAPGTYAVNILIDGRQLRSLDFVASESAAN